MARDRNDTLRIVIVGAGVFGLSTALALIHRPEYENAKITILDAATRLPNVDGASVDTSRILRADYAETAYTRLVSEAKLHWRNISDSGWGGEGRYHPAALLLTAQPGTEGHVDGYLEESLENLDSLARSGQYGFDQKSIETCSTKADVKNKAPLLEVSGEHGYLNKDCGWVNAEACVQYVLDRLKLEAGDRLEIRCNSRVSSLLYTESSVSTGSRPQCCGVELDNGTTFHSDLLVLAAGAWTPSLINLKGQAVATGQVLAYLSLTQEEQETFQTIPICFNVSRGMFMVPPHDCELKIGRHGFGYQNPNSITFSARRSEKGTLSSKYAESSQAIVSTPWTDIPIPSEARAACKEFLVELFPQWKDRDFHRTRVCWYCDT